MAHLTIRVLGPLEVGLEGEPASGFASDKVRALLVYLALSPDRPHRREVLAGLLWPESPERSARTNLRNALANLRQVIRDGAASAPFLHSTRQTIQFNSQSDYWLDADALEDLLVLLPAMSVQLEQAVELVRGSFLEGFTLADAAPFEEWLLLRREHFHRQVVKALDSLAAVYEERGSYERALAHTRRRVELEPWQEDGQQQLMRLLAATGRHAQAVAHYEAYRGVLAEELGVEPDPDTTRLHEQIRNGELELPTVVLARERDSEAPPRLPGFLEQETDGAAPPVFVARERELARLNTFLDKALAGHGQVVFVTGGPGQGKTTLLAEFGRRAMEDHPDLLVASGNCNAYSGVGDPYLPFHEILEMLTGDVEGRWASGLIISDHARRLWSALPQVLQALSEHGPHVMPALVSGKGLLSRAMVTAPEGEPWLQSLEQQIARQIASADGVDQSHLFQQVTNVLRALAQAHPLALILEDLQWADTASIGLLFHLGRRLEGVRILVLGTYRPVEVALGREGVRHPLEKLLREFKRSYGDVWLNLSKVEEPEQRHFVDALLDTEPNSLGEDFRRELAEHTGGHPLFTVELLEAMERRGDLIRDEMGIWHQAPALDWETLPARVEGVIEEQVGRLEPELREILSVASVEGETFTVAVVAEVLGMKERQLLRWLAQELERRHGLVLEQAGVQLGLKRLNRFKFGHALVQNYVYRQLSRAERRLLHADIATALEGCYGDQADRFAVQLAHHYHEAGDDGHALSYFTQAAEHASRVYGNDEAFTHYTRALEAAASVAADPVAVIKLHLGRGLAAQRLGNFDGALADYESALQQIAGSANERDLVPLRWQGLVDLGRLWTSRDYSRAHSCFQEARELAQQMGDPRLLAGSLNWIGNWHLNAEAPTRAITHHQQALAIFERLHDRRGLATSLDLLGVASLIRGDIAASVEYYDRAIALFRELDALPSLASSLTGRGYAGGSIYSLLASVSPAISTSPRRDFEETISIAREIGSLAGEAFVAWSLGTLQIVHGCYGQALEIVKRGLDIATQIEHREWTVGNRCILGVLYVELLAPEEARRELEAALALAEELRSRYWIHQATGALAAAYCLHDDFAQAQTCLETVLSLHRPMDTLCIRYCWARRAELALCQGDLVLALDIVERLIASAPGMEPGRVISFLWKVKAEALTGFGRTDEAQTLLQEAIENARVTDERFLLWRLHASLGRVQAAMGDAAEAEAHFSTARRLVAELADTIPAQALRDSFLRGAHRLLRSPP